MPKEPLVLQPRLFNALVPSFLKNLLIIIIIAAIVSVILFVLRFFEILSFTNETFILYSIILIIVLSISSLLIKIMVLTSTKYYFHSDHITKEEKIIKVKKHSIPYNQITDVRTHISFWDRISGAGRINLHTAEEGVEFALASIQNPEKVESYLHNLISKHKSSK